MNIGEMLAWGAALWIGSKVLFAKPHDMPVDSFDQLKLGMSWSGADGRQWYLSELNPDTGKIKICADLAGGGDVITINGRKQKAQGFECKEMHWSELRSLISNAGILMV